MNGNKWEIKREEEEGNCSKAFEEYNLYVKKVKVLIGNSKWGREIKII